MTFIVVLMIIVIWFSAFQAFGIGNFGVTYVDLLAAALYGIFFFKIVFKNIKLTLPKHVLTYSFFIFWISALISSVTLFAELPKDQILQFCKTFAHFSFVAFLFVIVLTYDFDDKVITNAMKSLLILSIGINIFGVYQIIARAFNLPLAWISITNNALSMRGTLDMAGNDAFEQLSLQFGNFYRATSIFSEPSTLAQFNLYILLFILIPYLQKKKPFFKSRILNTFIVIFSVSAVFLTFSLTAMLGLFLILVMILILENNKVRKKILRIAFAAVLIVVPINFIIQGITEISVFDLFGQRLAGIFNNRGRMEEGIVGESFHTRFSSVEMGLHIWEKSPLIGSGLGLTQFDKDAENADIIFFDSSIISALSETGLLGALSFAAFFAALFIESIKGRNYLKNNNIPDQQFARLIGLAPYIMIIQIEVNIFTANFIINWNLWLIGILAFVPIIKFVKMRCKSIELQLSDKHFLKESKI